MTLLLCHENVHSHNVLLVEEYLAELNIPVVPHLFYHILPNPLIWTFFLLK